MPAFSALSAARLATCHPDLQALFQEVVKGWDCVVLEGERSHEQQVLNVQKGVSKTLESKHIPEFSQYPVGVDAVDVAPYPLKWPQAPKDATPAERLRVQKDVARFYYFSGYVLGIATRMGIRIRHGGDWDGDRDIHDQNFDDLPHFERLHT